MANGALLTRDRLAHWSHPLIPAQAGIQSFEQECWIPAFAGMTGEKGKRSSQTPPSLPGLTRQIQEAFQWVKLNVGSSFVAAHHGCAGQARA